MKGAPSWNKVSYLLFVRAATAYLPVVTPWSLSIRRGEIGAVDFCVSVVSEAGKIERQRKEEAHDTEIWYERGRAPGFADLL